MPRPLLSAIVVTCGLLGAAGSASASLYYNGTPPATSDRFLRDTSGNPIYTSPNPDFILSGFDLSGIAVGDRGAVLISSTHYLTSAHYLTINPQFVGSDGVVRTYASAPSSNFTILQTTYFDGTSTVTEDSDLVIAELASPIPASDGVTPLPLLSTDSAFFVGQTTYAFDQDDRAGRNLIDSVDIAGFDEEPVRPTWSTFYDFDSSTNDGTDPLLPDEIGLTGGDSSHASLLIHDGQLAALGTHFAVSTENPTLDANYSSVSTLASAYLEQIQAAVEADGQSVSIIVVPEPAAGIAIAGVCGLLLSRRRSA